MVFVFVFCFYSFVYDFDLWQNEAILLLNTNWSNIVESYKRCSFAAYKYCFVFHFSNSLRIARVLFVSLRSPIFASCKMCVRHIRIDIWTLFIFFSFKIVYSFQSIEQVLGVACINSRTFVRRASKKTEMNTCLSSLKFTCISNTAFAFIEPFHTIQLYEDRAAVAHFSNIFFIIDWQVMHTRACATTTNWNSNNFSFTPVSRWSWKFLSLLGAVCTTRT